MKKPKTFLARAIVMALGVMLSISLFSQSPTITMRLGLGLWSAITPGEEWPYTTFSNWRTNTKSVGAGVDFAPDRALSFAPDLNFELYRHRYNISSLAGWEEISDRNALYVRASPGLRLHLTKHVFLRAGLSLQMLMAAWGKLVVSYRSGPGTTVTKDYSEDPRAVLRLFTWGPDLQIVGFVPLGKKGALEPGITTYFSFSRTQQEKADVPYNPGIFQFGLQLGYSFPSGPKTEHGYDGDK